MDRVLTRDPYAAMLMAMHGVALMNAGYGKYAYPPDRTSDPRVKAYVDHQEDLRLKLLDELRQSEQFKQHCSDEQIWTNYEYMEVFDQLAQFVCNRYPLNSKARKLGPTDSLNDVDIPTKHGQPAVKIKIDTVGENKACCDPILLTSIRYQFRSPRAWCRTGRTKTAKTFSASFIAPSASP